MDLLDAIVSAVSEVILVFSQAQKEENRMEVAMPVANFNVLLVEIDRMVDVQVNQLSRIDDAQLQHDMHECNVAIKKETNALKILVEGNARVVNNIYRIPREIYSPFHGHLKGIIVGMVRQTQIIDKCNVKIMLQSTQMVLDVVRRMKNATSVQELNSIWADMDSRFSTFVSFINHRIGDTTDPEIRSSLFDSLETIKSHTPNLYGLCAHVLQYRQPEAQNQRDVYIKDFVLAIQSILKGLQDSAKYVADFSLLFDLPEWEAYLRGGDVETVIGLLMRPNVHKNASEFNNLLQRLQSEVSRQFQMGKMLASKITDPRKQQQIIKDLNELQEVMGALAVAAKYLQDNPNDPQAIANFHALLQRAGLISNRITQAGKPEQDMMRDLDEINNLLQQLLIAASQGKIQETTQLSDTLWAAYQKQVDSVTSLATALRDPAITEAVTNAGIALQKAVYGAIGSSKSLASAPLNESNRNQALSDAEVARIANLNLGIEALEVLLVSNRRAAEYQLEKLVSASKKGDAPEVSELSKDCKEILKRHHELGMALHSRVTDAKINRQIGSALGQLESKQFTLDAIEKGTERPEKVSNDADAIAEILPRVSSRLIASNPEREFLDNHQNLQILAAKLASSMKNRDLTPEQMAALANSLLKAGRDQIAMAREVAPEYPNMTEALLNAAQELEDTLNALEKLNPNDPKDEAKIVELTNKALEGSNALNALVLEAQLEANHAKLVEKSGEVRQEMMQGDFQEANKKIPEVNILAARQAELGQALANATKNPESARQIGQATKALVGHSMMLSTHQNGLVTNPPKMAPLVDDDLHKIVAASAAISGLNQGAGDEALQNWAKLNELEEKLRAQLEKGDSKGASETLKEIAEAYKQQASVGKILAAKASPEDKAKLAAACKNLEERSRELTALAASGVLSEVQKRQLEEALISGKKSSDEITKYATAEQGDKEDLANIKQVIENGRKYQAGLTAVAQGTQNGDTEAMTTAARELVAVVRAQGALTKAMAAKYQSEAPNALSKEHEESLPQVIKTMRDVLGDFGNETLRGQLSSSMFQSAQINSARTLAVLEGLLAINHQKLKDQLQKLRDMASAGDIYEANKAAKGLKGAADVQTDLGRELEKLVSNKDSLEQIQDGIKGLDKKTVKLVKAVNEAVQNPNAKHDKTIAKLSAKAEFNSQKITSLKRFGKKMKNPEDALIANSQKLHQLSSSVKDGKKDHKEVASHAVEVATDQIRLATDGDFKGLRDHVAELEDALEAYSKAAEKDKTNHSKENQKEAEKRLAELLEANDKLVTAALEDQLAKNLGNLKGELGNLGQTLKNGDKEGSKDNFEGSKSLAERHADLGKKLADSLADEDKKKAVLEAVEELKSKSKDFDKTTSKSLDSPSDPQSQKQVNQVSTETAEAAVKVTSLRDPAVKDVDILGSRIKRANEKLEEALRSGDDAAIRREVAKLSDLLDRQVKAARAVAEKIEDPKQKQKILETADALQSSKGKLDALKRTYADRPYDAYGKSELEKIKDQINKDNETLGKLANPDSVAEKVLVLAALIEGTQARAKDAEEKKDEKERRNEIATLADEAGRQAKAGRALAEKFNGEEDRQKKAQVLAACDALDRSKAALSNLPNETAKREALLAEHEDQVKRNNELLKRAAGWVGDEDQTAQKLIQLASKVKKNREDLDKSLSEENDQEALDHITNLLAAARQAIDLGKVILPHCKKEKTKAKVNEAIANLEEARAKLDSLSEEYYLAPMDDNGRKEIAQLANIIQKNTDALREAAESLFNPEDPLERVLELAEQIKEDQRKLEEALASGNDEEAKIQAGKLSAHLKQQAEALEKAAEQSKEQKSKDRFKDASDKLKEIAKKLDKVNDDYANKALDEFAKKELRDLSRGISEANASAEREAGRLASPRETTNTVLNLAEKIEKDLKDTENAKNSGDQKKLASELAKLGEDVQNQAAAGRALAVEVKDKKNKQKVQEASASLDSNKAKLDELQREYAGKQLDDEGKKKLEKITDAIKKANRVLKAAAERLEDEENPLDSALELCKKIDEDRSNLGGAVAARDEQTTKHETARLKDHVEKQSKAAALLAEVGTEDPNLKKRLKEASEGLKEEKKKLEEFQKKREGKPRMDESTKKELEAIDEKVAKHNEEIRKIAGKLANPNDLTDGILANHQKIKESSEKINDSNDDNETKAEIARLAEYAGQQAAAGRELAQEIEDPKSKEKVLEASKTLEQNREKLEALQKEYANKPLDEAGKAKLEQFVESTNAASEVLKRAAERHANPDNKFDAALALSQKVSDDLKNSQKALDSNDDKASKSELAKLAEDSGALAKAAEALASETTDERLKQKALEAAKKLEDGKKKLEEVLKEYEGKPLDASAKEKIKGIKKQLEEANEAVREVAEKLAHPNEASDNVLALHKKIAEELENAGKAKNKSDEKATKSELEKLKSDVPKQAKAGKALAKEIHDPKASKKVEEISENLEQNAKKLNELSSKPLEEENKSKLDSVLAAIKRGNEALKKAAERQANPDNKFDLAQTLAEKIEEDQRNLNDALAKKNDPNAKFEEKKLAGHVGQQAKVARSLAAEAAGDDKAKQKALDAASTLDKSKKRLEALDKEYAEKPFDAVAKSELDDINAQIKVANDNVKQLAQQLGADTNSDEVLANSKRIKEHSEKAKKGLKSKDDKATKQQLAALEESVKDQLEAGNVLAESLEEGKNKERAKEALEDLERSKEKLEELQKEFAGKPFDEKGRKKAERLLKNLKDANRALEKVAAKTSHGSSDSDSSDSDSDSEDEDEKIQGMAEDLEETLEELKKKDNSAKKLSNLAKDVAKQSKKLAKATKEGKKKGREGKSDEEEERHQKVVKAAERLEAAAAPLVESIEQKVKNGASPASDAKVDEGVEKTTRALNDLKSAIAEKELEGLSDELKENLEKLNKSVAAGKTAEARAAHDASQKGIEKTIQIGKDLSKSAENPKLAKQIEKAVKVLEEKKEKLREAQKEAISLPTEQKIKEVKKLTEEILDAAERINGSKHLPEDSKKPEKEITQNSQELKEILRDLQKESEKGDKEKTSKESKKLDQLTERQVGLARNIADQVSDQKKWGEIVNAIQAVEESNPKVNEAAEHLANHPEDPKAKENLRNEVANRLDAERKLNAAILDDQFEKNLKDLEKQKKKIADSLKGSAQVTSDQAKEFKDTLERQSELGRGLAGQTRSSEAEKQKKLKQLSDVLESKTPDFTAAAAEKGRGARAEKLEQVLDQIDDALDRFNGKKTSGSEEPADQCDELLYKTNFMAPKLDQLSKSASNPEVNQELFDYEVEENDKDLEDEAALAKKLAERVSDKSLQYELSDNADKLEKARKSLKESREGGNQGRTPEKKAATDKALKDAKDANAALKRAAEAVKHKDAFSAKVEEKKDAISTAADTVAKAANVQPVNEAHSQFLKIIRSISQDMTNMGKNAAKTDMIVAARAIASHIENVQKLSTTLAQPCTDPKLKDALLNLSRVPKNYSVQLKIIAAVKSDSGESDKSAHNQLATCASSLAAAVVKCAHAAEAAALASPKDSIAWAEHPSLPAEFYKQVNVGSVFK